MFVQCFVNTNYNGWDHFGGICKIGDNFFTLILLKVIVKSLDDNKHIGSASFMIFLGAGPEDLHTSPWFVWSGLTSTLAFLSALLLYKILKARCVTYSLIFGIFYRLLLLFDFYSVTITSIQDSPARNPQRQHNLKDGELGEWEETFCCGIAIRSLYILHFGD